MFIPRIYYPYPIQIEELLLLDKEISHYLITVLRFKNNEPVVLFNGTGGEFFGECQVLKKNVQVRVLSFQDVQRQSVLSLHLAQALVRGDRMDVVIQKATELGITSITPVISARCAVKMDEVKLLKRVEHWKKIAISASEQCGRTEIPTIHSPCLLKKWASQPFNGCSVILDPQATNSLKKLNPQLCIRLAIGPESGWLETETNDMISQGFTACSLGPRILRTETAAIAAVSILQSHFGDL